MKIPLAYGASKRLTGRFPEVVQINLIAEKTETQIEQPLALICRGGAIPFRTLGTHPIRSVAQKDGLFSGDMILPCQDAVYRLTKDGVATAFAGAIPGYQRLRVAIGRNEADDDAARIATGTGLYIATGITCTAEDFPDVGGAGASDVEFHKGFWLAIEAGTDKIYYLIPAEGTWTGLDFASAEYQPDAAVAIRSRGDQFWVLGRKTTEGWYLTGDGASPMAPAPGLAFDFGCLARDTAIVVGSADSSALMWVDNQCSVRMTKGGEPTVVSDHGLAGEIRALEPTDLRAATYSKDGHFFYCLTLADTGTAVYDLTSNLWSRFTSQGYDYWRAHMICDTGGDGIFAIDALSNQIWTLDPDAETDDGAAIATACTAYLEQKEGRQDCNNLTLDGSVGFVNLLETDPQISIRLCRDGQTYGSPKYANLPLTGQFKRVPRWNRCGQVLSPHGLWVQIACSDATVKRYSGLNMNVKTR